MKAASTPGSIVTMYLEVVGATMLLHACTRQQQHTAERAALPHELYIVRQATQELQVLHTTAQLKAGLCSSLHLHLEHPEHAPCTCMQSVKAALELSPQL